jgi:alpha,alpha-trehalase
LRIRALARTLEGVMSTTAKSRRGPGKSADGGEPAVENKKQADKHSATMPQSAAAPSPFTPIADYAFLSNSNRHTGALVAPDGTVDWLRAKS